MAGKSHVGKAGQLATMAEFLLRGYNVAMSEVDTGDDICVVHDREGQLWRIQVKTAVGKGRGYGYSGKFAVSWDQLTIKKKPDLFYVFALRAGKRWDFVLIQRMELYRLQKRRRIAVRSRDKLIFTLRFSATDVRCAGVNLQLYRDRWDPWPIIAD
jgi:hypothetical protein